LSNVAVQASPSAEPQSETAWSAAVVYRERHDRFAATRDELTGRWNRVSNLRLAAFAAGAAGIAWFIWGGARVGLIGGIALLAVFVALAIYHARLGRQRRRAATLTAINSEAAARVARDWIALPQRHAIGVPPDHPFATDLDLVGHASLAHLLDTTTTPPGEQTLLAWLLAPAPPVVVVERQVAVAELAPRIDFRQDLELRGRLGATDRADPEPILAWAETPPWLACRPWLRVAAWVGPLALVALVAAQLLGYVDRPYWALAILFNLLISQTLARPAQPTIAAVARHHRALLGYSDQLDLLLREPLSAPLAHRLQAELGGGDATAPSLLRRLSRLAALAIPPSSMLYLPIQAVTVWDVHVLAALERWQTSAGGHARRWLGVLGEAEALSALATLSHDNPDWVSPTLDPAADTVAALGLGHPLLPAATRVVNDVAVGPPGTFLLVTGSNMSGKSTLLRAIGVNAVLAGAGGPVCAGALRLPPVALWTSVRVQDSLERGVSFFMAELQRLKLVVDAARRQHEQGGPRVLYLLDEILQGTNTVERQIAARRIIAFLVDSGAIGAVSTHDLALGDAPELAARARPVHFTDTVGDGIDRPVMSFDYRLRSGVATTTNALRLMEMVGLDLDVGESAVDIDQEAGRRPVTS
jgi:predicted ATPase